jgi:hypothetical protein
MDDSVLSSSHSKNNIAGAETDAAFLGLLRHAFPISRHDLVADFGCLLRAIHGEKGSTSPTLNITEFKEALTAVKGDLVRYLSDESLCKLFVHLDKAQRRRISCNDFVNGIRVSH